MNRRSLWLLLMALLFSRANLGMETTHPPGPERLVELQRQVAAQQPALPELAQRVIAVSLSVRMTPAGENKWRIQKADFPGRLYASYNELKKVDATLNAAPIPAAHRDLLRLEFYRNSLWPVRYRASEMPVASWEAVVAQIPAQSRLIKLDAGGSLDRLLTEEIEGWRALSPAIRKSIYDRLSVFNPLMRSDGGYRSASGKVQNGFAPGDGVDPLVQAMYGQLEAYAPELAVAPLKDQQFELLVFPLDPEYCWVLRYRVNVGMYLFPDRETLKHWTRDLELDLGNIPLIDLKELQTADIRKLDLGGTQISSLDGLEKASSLYELRLDGCPVTDLSPLRGLKLQRLDLRNTQVTDLSPLRGMPIEHLDLRDAPVTDLTPLVESNLKVLLLSEDGDYTQLDNVSALPSLGGKLGDVPVQDWLREHAWKRQTGRFWDDPEAQARCSAPGSLVPQDCPETQAPSSTTKPASPPPKAEPKKKLEPKLEPDAKGPKAGGEELHDLNELLDKL